MKRCEFCGTEFGMAPYGEGRCPWCGQEYGWDEGIFPILTEAQCEIIRAYNMEQKRKKGTPA